MALIDPQMPVYDSHEDTGIRFDDELHFSFTGATLGHDLRRSDMSRLHTKDFTHDSTTGQNPESGRMPNLMSKSAERRHKKYLLFIMFSQGAC